MPACSGRRSAESPGTFDVCREKSFRLPQGDGKKKKARGGVCVCVCMQGCVLGGGGTDCHSPKDTRLSFLFSAPCFIYRPFCPIWFLIMRAHSSTDVRGRHPPTDIVIRARHVAGHLQRGSKQCLENRVLKDVRSAGVTACQPAHLSVMLFKSFTWRFAALPFVCPALCRDWKLCILPACSLRMIDGFQE